MAHEKISRPMLDVLPALNVHSHVHKYRTGAHATNRKSQALTTAWVKQATKPGAYGDGYGLTLRIDAKGNKRWIQRLTIGGRQRNTGLGSWPGVSLDEAREKALANWRAAREGRDPIGERRMARANTRMPRLPTFEEVALRVIALRRPTWSSDKHAAQWESSLATYVFPAIGRELVNAVSTADVLGRAGAHLDYQAGDGHESAAAHGGGVRLCHHVTAGGWTTRPWP